MSIKMSTWPGLFCISLGLLMITWSTPSFGQGVLRQNIGSLGSSSVVNQVYVQSCVGQSYQTLSTYGSYSYHPGFIQPAVRAVVEPHQHQFSIYPNPVSEQLHVVGDLETAMAIRVYDLKGTLITDQTITFNRHHSLDCEHWVAGVYILEIGFGQDTYRRKFIKH